MFNIFVSRENDDFYNYLKKECISFDNKNYFSFIDKKTAVDVFSRYFLYFLRQKFTSLYQNKFNLDDSFIKNLDILITSSDFIQVLKMIQKKLEFFLEDNIEFSFNAFLVFRLKDESSFLENVISKTIENTLLSQTSDDNLSDLKKIVSNSNHYVDSLFVKSNGQEIEVYNKKNIIFSEPNFNEDFVLSQIITLNPVNLYIQHDTFSLETDEIINFVFGERSIYCEKLNTFSFED